MRTSVQLALFLPGLWFLGCVRNVCVQEEIEEEASSGVSTSKTFLFDTFDQNQDRVIDYEEFRERMSVRFDILDTDKSGKIDLGKECRDNPWCTPALAKGKSKLTLGLFLNDAISFFESADKSGDRRLERKEFSKLPTEKTLQ